MYFQGTKSHENCSQGIEKHQKMSLKSTESRYLWQVGFCTPFTPNACFPNSIRPDSYQKIIKKEPWKDKKKNHQCCSKVPEKLSKWGPKIHLKTMELRLWIPGCPFCCSYGLPRLPQGAKVVPQGAKMEPPGLPTGSFGHQKWPRPLRKSQLFENSDLKTNIQKSASQHTFQQINLAELK